MDEEGVAKYERVCDENGNLEALVCFGVDGRPCLNKYGVAKYVLEYEGGFEKKCAYFGVDGKPCLCADGDAGYMCKYDECGNCVEWAYFGVDGRPCLRKKGYAHTTAAYDKRGNFLEWACFGVDGKPCLSVENIAGVTNRYNARGDVEERTYFGVDGKPRLNKDGYAGFTCEYDSNGELTTETFFNAAGERLTARPQVNEILPDSQAERLGLRVGDILLEYGGREFDSVAQFIQYCGQETDDATRLLRVLRDSEIKTFDVSPGKLDAVLEPVVLPQETLDVAREKAEIAAQTVENETEGESAAWGIDSDAWFEGESDADESAPPAAESAENAEIDFADEEDSKK